MRRLSVLPLSLAIAAIVALLARNYSDEPGRKDTRIGKELDGPPPRELMEARFGGDKVQAQPQAQLQPAAPSEVTIATANWQELGPLNMTDRGQTTIYEPSQGRVDAVAGDAKNPQHLYAAGASGGVWVTTDGGTTWAPRAQTLPIITVSSIVVDQNNGNIVYIGTGDADGFVTPSIGVYKSIDGGATWKATGLTFPVMDRIYIAKLAIDPTNGAKVYAAASDGVYYTSNGGTNWTKVQPSAGVAPYRDIKIRPGTPSTVYTVTDAGEFFRSVDSGQSWKPAAGPADLAAAQRAVLGVTAANSSLVYILAALNPGGTDLGIFKSTDGGGSFARIPSSTLTGQASNQATFYDLVLAVSPTNANELMAGVFGAIRSTDGGATWIYASVGTSGAANPIVHVDQHAMEYINNAIYDGSDGGLHRSTDGAAHWANLSPTLGIGQVYQVSGSRQNPSLIFVGEQDNGFNRYNAGKWEHLNVGDFGRVAVDPTNDQVVFASANYGVFKYTDIDGAAPTEIKVTTEGKRFEGAPIVINPSNGQAVYAGYQNLFRSANGGANWQNLTNFPADGLNVDVIVLAPSDPKTIYLARSNGFGNSKVYRSTNEGGKFDDISAGLPDVVTGIAVDPANPMRLWATLQGGNTNAIYFSGNGGANWSNYSGTSLPNSSTRAVVYETGSKDGLYVGTVAGVYFRDSTMADWKAYNTNLPNVVVDSLEIDYNSRKLRAGTYGRGLWQTSLATATPGLIANVSTRLPVGTGDNALIEGFIVQGAAGSTKKILVRAIGPSLRPFGITDALANPTLDIFDSSNTKIASNDDWKTTQAGGIITGDQAAEIQGSKLAPSNDLESAIIASLAPGSYTAVVRGAGNSVGTGVVDAFDLSAASSARLANISTRGLIQPGDKLMIAGFIIQNGSARAVITAVGPSLAAFGITNALPDTTLQLRDQNGVIVRENDDWMSDQKAELESTGLQPSNKLEAALVQTIPPGQYTAQVRGKPESTGIGVVQVYFLQ